MILKTGFKPGNGAKFGKGIYTSPRLETVQRLYAQEFTYKEKYYKMVLQNRVNPDQFNGHLIIIPASQTGVGADYWLTPEGLCATDVRPYGILIREVQGATPQPATQCTPLCPRPVPHCPQPSPRPATQSMPLGPRPVPHYPQSSSRPATQSMPLGPRPVAHYPQPATRQNKKRKREDN